MRCRERGNGSCSNLPSQVVLEVLNIASFIFSGLVDAFVGNSTSANKTVPQYCVYYIPNNILTYP